MPLIPPGLSEDYREGNYAINERLQFELLFLNFDSYVKVNTPAQQGACTMHKATSLSTDLRAAAAALQAGIADPKLAIVLNALAAADEKPTGHSLRLLGGGNRPHNV
ncbi:hypothetical protein [Stenotrophomonas maltophilia]|uniref:hypothetical protein n=1 Tax=Stenotrophomonas maltophilia TaxID=40324 RepID=UPI003BF8E017